MPKEKLVLGLATYGRTFKIKDSYSILEGSQAIGAGEAGFVKKNCQWFKLSKIISNII